MRTKSALICAVLLATGAYQCLFAQNTIDAFSSASRKLNVTGGKAYADSAVLTWTDGYTNGTIEELLWGTSTSYGNTINLKPVNRSTNTTVIKGLTPNTKYYAAFHRTYQSKGSNVTTAFQFTTAAGAAQANKPPAITSEATAACTTSKTVTYTITATDADNDPVTFTVSGQPSWITFASPKLTLKPVGGSANALVKLIATDGKGGADTLNLTVTVVQSTSVAEMAHMAGARTLTFGTSQIRFPASADPLVAVSLFTLGGAQIMHRNIKAERGDITMPTEGVTSGVYLLRLHNAAFSTMQRVSFRE